MSDRGVMSSDPSEVPTPPPRPANSWAPARAPVLGPVEKHRNSTAVFILGLLGMLLCFVLAPIAWIMGSNARGEIQRSQGRLESDGLLTAGWIMGIIGTVLIGAIVIAILIAVAAAA